MFKLYSLATRFYKSLLCGDCGLCGALKSRTLMIKAAPLVRDFLLVPTDAHCIIFFLHTELFLYRYLWPSTSALWRYMFIFFAWMAALWQDNGLPHLAELSEVWREPRVTRRHVSRDIYALCRYVKVQRGYVCVHVWKKRLCASIFHKSIILHIWHGQHKLALSSQESISSLIHILAVTGHVVLLGEFNSSLSFLLSWSQPEVTFIWKTSLLKSGYFSSTFC